ncbi:MAG: GNAT family N-acetyltransferase [Patescibacteria group bacterium]
MNYVIKTKRFVLRPYRLSDAPAVARNINDYKIYRYTLHIPYPYRLSDATKWFAKTIPQYRQRSPKDIQFAIEMDREIVGCVGLSHIEPRHKAEIGYWLARRYWGQGIIPEAVKLVVNYAFKKFKLHRVYAYTFVPNRASQKVLKKNGFKREGLMRKVVKKRGRLISEYLWAKVK